MRFRLAILAGSFALALGGCGGGGSLPQPLAKAIPAPSDARFDHAVSRIVLDIANYCIAASDPDVSPSPREKAAARRATALLIDGFRRHPDAIYEPGGRDTRRSLRRLVSDTIATLRSDCSSELADALTQAQRRSAG